MSQTALPYMQDPWFSLLLDRCKATARVRIAERLGISQTALSMVINGTGPYGAGAASTTHIAERVIHTFGRYTCPHLSADAGGNEEIEVTAERCRSYAHRPPPTGSPRAMQHWQACLQCPHREASAPPVERNPVPRKPARALSANPTAQEVTREAL